MIRHLITIFDALTICLLIDFGSPAVNAQVIPDASDVLEAFIAGRDADLVKYQAEFLYEGKFPTEAKETRWRDTQEKRFIAVSKRDGPSRSYRAYHDSELISVLVLHKGGGFRWSEIVGAAKYQSLSVMEPSVAAGLRLVDPLSLGISASIQEVFRENYLREIFGLTGLPGIELTVTPGTRNGVPTWDLGGEDPMIKIRFVFDQQNFRLLFKSQEFLDERRQITCELTYSGKFATQHVPSLVQLCEVLDDQTIFTASWTMTAFDPDPKLTDDDFTMKSIGLPIGLSYYDDTTRTAKTWGGNGPVSSSFLAHPQVSRDLLRRKAAEDAAKSVWTQNLLFYLLGVAGIVCVGAILVRRWAVQRR